MKLIRNTFIILIAAFAVACAPKPSATPNQPGHEADIWFAGDSIAALTYQYMVTYPQIFPAMGGGNAFTHVHGGTTIQSRVLDNLDPTDLPEVVLVQGSTNDFRDFAVVTTAMTQFETDLNNLGIQVVWVTSPVGEAMVGWSDSINNWMIANGNVIDCNTPLVRAWGTTDGVHPSTGGLAEYAKCLDIGVKAL